MFPFSNVGGWIQLLLSVGATVVLAICLWQVFAPMVKLKEETDLDYERRTEELMKKYSREDRNPPRM